MRTRENKKQAETYVKLTGGQFVDQFFYLMVDIIPENVFNNTNDYSDLDCAVMLLEDFKVPYFVTNGSDVCFRTDCLEYEQLKHESFISEVRE